MSGTEHPLVQSAPRIQHTMSDARDGIGESLFVKGELSASEDLIIRGQVEGSISLPGHTLTVDGQAKVNAKIAARAVVVIGNVKGPVTTADRIEIRASGSIVGDVSAPRLVIVDGGSLQGKVEMPARKKEQGDAEPRR